MALSSVAERAREKASHELIRLLHDAGEHVPAPEREDFGTYFDRFGSAKVVLLGEATHGTSEFYRAPPSRASLSNIMGSISWPSKRTGRTRPCSIIWYVNCRQNHPKNGRSNGSEAVLPEQFDAFVWFEDTRAVEPLTTQSVKGAPDTYPFGFGS